MKKQEASRRDFIQCLAACAMPSTFFSADTETFGTQTPEPMSALIRDRIGLALDLQALFAVAIDEVDIEALTSDRLLRATTGQGKGENRGRDAALDAVLRHGRDFESAAGSFLLLGVRPRALRYSDLAAARKAVRSKGAWDHQFIYAVYPDRSLADGQVEATLIAAWNWRHKAERHREVPFHEKQVS
jgi:hypothetical protein